MMELKNLYFYDHQVEFLENLKGKFSEHVRRAVDDYIKKIKNGKVSASQSKGRE